MVAYFVADLCFAGNQIGNDVIFTLRAGDFDFADFHAIAIQKEALLQFGHLADGKTQHDKTSGGIVGNDSGGERIIGRDNGLRSNGGGRSRAGGARRPVMQATGRQHSGDYECQRHERFHGDS